MTLLEKEIDNNQESFYKDWTAQAVKNCKALHKSSQYKHSYRRISCLHALKDALIMQNCSSESAAFFLEAHNDALLSHVSAAVGAWRPALQALRSCIENVLCSLYYKDHPVELELWSAGKFWIGFSDLHKYMAKHPLLSGLTPAVTGLPILKNEYATLSKAVHASAANFRMTDKVATVLLWDTNPARIGMWTTRERRVLEGVSLLLVALYHAKLQGTRVWTHNLIQ